MEEISYIKLSDLSRRIEQVFKQNFSLDFYWIVAEVSGHKFYPDSDRHYFDLVEKSSNSEVEVAKIKAKSWSEGSSNILEFERLTGQKFQSGLQVLIQVKVEYHPLYGLSLTLIDIDASYTLGNIEKQRRDTLIKLVNENSDFIKFYNEEYITKNKKLKLKEVIQKIALIASPNSEGYSDFVHTIASNQYNYKFEIDNYFSSVQGREAERELINTLIKIHQSNIDYDCVVLIRGGGAKTDFLVFDTYHLARAVAKFPIPIITGIGHHKDVSIVDLMAHSPTKTPTKCAEYIISINKKFEEHLVEFQNSIIIKVQQILGHSILNINNIQSRLIGSAQKLLAIGNEDLANTNSSIINSSKDLINDTKQELNNFAFSFLSKPFNTIERKMQTIDYLSKTLQYQTSKLIVAKSSEINHFLKVMKLMSPENILKKGFAIVSVNNNIVVDAGMLKKGEEIKISMHTHEIDASVNNINKRNGEEYNL